MHERFLDRFGAGGLPDVDGEGLTGCAQDVDTALSWLCAAGDLEAERWGASVAQTLNTVESMQSRFPELGHPARSLLMAAFISFARSSGLRAEELAQLVEIPEWMRKQVDLMRACGSMTSHPSARLRARSGASAGHSCRSASRRDAGRSSGKRVFDAKDGGFLQ